MGYRMKRSFDLDHLNHLLNHPEIFPAIAPDGVNYINAASILSKPTTHFLAGNGGGLLFWRVSNNIYEGDVYFPARYRGPMARQITKQSLDYMFGFADKILAKAPSFNRPSRHFVRSLGFRATGIDPEPFIKNNVRYEVITYELDRDTWEALSAQSQAAGLRKQQTHRSKPLSKPSEHSKSSTQRR